MRRIENHLLYKTINLLNVVYLALVKAVCTSFLLLMTFKIRLITKFVLTHSA